MIYLLVRRFGQLQGWLPEEVIVLYALTLLSYGISGLFFMGTMGQLEQLVLRGELDQYLTKPLNPLLQMTARTFNLGYANHVVLSMSVLVVTLRAMNLSWSPVKEAYLLLAITGAALIQCAVWLGTGSAAFWLTRAGNVQALLLHDLRQASSYPVSIYGRGVQAALTFVLPWAFVGLYPAAFLLDRPMTAAERVAGALAPLVGLATFGVAYRLWRRGLDSYQGGGA